MASVSPIVFVLPIFAAVIIPNLEHRSERVMTPTEFAQREQDRVVRNSQRLAGLVKYCQRYKNGADIHHCIVDRAERNGVTIP